MLYIRISALFFVFCFSSILAFEASAQFEIEKNQEEVVRWELHESVTESYTAKFPEKYRYRIFPFKYNESTVAMASEIISTADGAVPSTDNNIFIKAVHTFGGELNSNVIDKAILVEAAKQRGIAKSLKGQLITNQKGKHKGYVSNDFYITYEKDGERIGVRTRLIFTSHAKIEQVITGVASGLYAYRAEDYFKSLQPKDGIIVEKNSELGFGWVDYDSPNNIYSFKLPPVNLDYMPRKPVFKSSSKRSIMRVILTDPVINENVIYSINAYKLPESVTPDVAKSIVFTNNVARYVENASITSLQPEYETTDNYNIMRTRLVITPPARYPYIQVVALEAMYKGNTIIVKELLMSARHSQSGIRSTLFDLVDFHPEKFKTVQAEDTDSSFDNTIEDE